MAKQPCKKTTRVKKQPLLLTKKGKPSTARNSYLLRKYGITELEYEVMLFKQRGTCYICHNPPKTIRLSVDHIHVKGYSKMEQKDKRNYVRGLLCFTCNVSIGKLEKASDPRKLLTGINDYFNEFKMRKELL